MDADTPDNNTGDNAKEALNIVELENNDDINFEEKPAAPALEIIKKTTHLNHTIRDKNILFMSYMPFLKNGGLFIPTSRSYQIGDEIILNCTFLNDAEKTTIHTQVVWITPKGVQTTRSPGVGVQFLNDATGVKDKIEKLIAGLSGTQKVTHTL